MQQKNAPRGKTIRVVEAVASGDEKKALTRSQYERPADWNYRSKMACCNKREDACTCRHRKYLNVCRPDTTKKDN
jgi:hypothetical protein